MTGMNIKKRLGHPGERTLSAEKLCKLISLQTGIYKWCIALQYSLVHFLPKAVFCSSALLNKQWHLGILLITVLVVKLKSSYSKFIDILC